MKAYDASFPLNVNFFMKNLKTLISGATSGFLLSAKSSQSQPNPAIFGVQPKSQPNCMQVSQKNSDNLSHLGIKLGRLKKLIIHLFYEHIEEETLC